MKTFIGILIFISFLQTSILPLNLILIILICRSYIRVDKSNLYLAFIFGLLIAYLNVSLMGFLSIVYLMIIQTTQILSKNRLAGNSLFIIPLVFCALSLNDFLLRDFNFTKIILESVLSLPIFYIVKIWEERFIVRKEIRLKV